MIGILGAMPEELELLLAELQQAEARSRGAFTLHRGTLAGQPLLLAQCGIGKVNAAALTQTMLLEGVSRLIVTGVAGAVAPELRVGDLVISRDVVHHDLDVTPLGYQLGEVPGEPLAFTADEALQKLALEAARALPEVNAVLGRVASGDQFIASAEKVRWLRETFGAACAEMEGAAVAQLCAKHGVPFVVIRSMSDTADVSAGVDFREFTPLAARRAKVLVRAMLERLPPPSA